VIAAVVLILLLGWLGIRGYRCKVRGKAFALEVESIKRDAAQEIRVGASKAEVSRFFEQHSIPFGLLETEAFRSLRTVGCAPFGCGTDRAFIGVHVKLDVTGTVTEAPHVVGGYIDCL